MNNLSWVALVMTVGGIALGGCVVDPTYTYCATTSECEARERCFEVTSSVTRGAFCSEECTADAQCERNLGFAGSCMNVDGLGGICFQECEIPSDCFSSSSCYDFTDSTGFTNRVCLPERL